VLHYAHNLISGYEGHYSSQKCTCFVLLYLQVGTNNLCVSTWTGTEVYCRAEAMGVILGVEDSTSIERKQKNLLK